MMKLDPKEILIKDLHEGGEISVRSYNVCCRTKIFNVQDLHLYLLKNEDFKTIKNCGEKSNKELLAVYEQRFIHKNSPDEKQGDTPKFVKTLEFEDTIENAFKNLSVRAQNCLLNYFKNKTKWEQLIAKHFVENIFEPSDLRNVGAKTTIEIKSFIDFCIEVYTRMKNDSGSIVDVKRYELKRLTGINVENDWIIEGYANNRLPLIGFSKLYIETVFNLDEVEVEIIKSFLGLTEDVLTLDKIAQKSNLTNERVRQKRQKAIWKIQQSQLLKTLAPFGTYSKLRENPFRFLSIPNDLNDLDIQLECSEAGCLFGITILGAILGETHYSLTANDRLIKPDDIYKPDFYSAHKRIKGHYLIEHELVPKEKLLSILNDILKLLCRRRENDITLSFTELVLTADSNVIALLTQLLSFEFDLDIQGDSILIARNTTKLVHEYAEEILGRLGKPAHISDIVSEITKQHPAFDSTENSVSSAMRREKDTFIFFGRTSTFGLKKWESTANNIKGGTIRDIVEEYLNEFDYPCHISAITKYVNKYRKTDSTSIITNLKVVADKRFTFFKNGFVGLSTKDYSKDVAVDDNSENISVDEILSLIFR